MIKKHIQKELVEFLRELPNHKSSIIDIVEKKLNVNIPKTYSYEKILSVISNKGKEKDFSKLYFNSNSFSEILEKRNINDSLYIFSKKELELIAKGLSHNKKLWNYNVVSLDKLRNTIVERSAHSDFSTLFPKLISEKKIYSVMQYYRAVVGPLGITRSKINRKSMEAEEMVLFLSSYVTEDTFDVFGAQTNFQKILSKTNLDKNLYIFAFHQYLLTNYTLKEIQKIFNTLLEQDLLQISSMEKFGSFTITPCGMIIEKSGDPIENLIQILVKNIPKNTLIAELEKEGFQSGSLESRLYAKCVWSKPEEILSNEFGKTTLREICKNLGLVGVQRVSELSELIQYLLLKIGFMLPEKITGISEYLNILKSYKNSLQYRPKSDYIPIMPNLYVMTEGILKDLIYFYTAIIWNSILDYENKSEILEEAHKKLKEEFELDKNVSELTFGKLISVMRKMNSRIQNDVKIKKQIQKKLHRTKLFPSDALSKLSKIFENRAKYTHDVTNQTPSANLSPEQILDDLLEIGTRFQEKNVYPLAIRPVKEVITEYGVFYSEVIDEFNNHIAIFSTQMLDAGKLGFMISNTSRVAIKPTIIEKYWK